MPENTSSVSGVLSSKWRFDTTLYVQTTAANPSLRAEFDFLPFATVGQLTLVLPGTDEDTDDVLSAEETISRMAKSPKDFIRYTEYKAKRGI